MPLTNSIALAQDKVSPIAFKLLYFICEIYEGQSGEAVELTVSALEAGSGLSRPTVIKGVKELEKAGRLVVTRTASHPSQYRPL